MNAPLANLERATLAIDGHGEVDLAAIRGEEELSAPFRYEARFQLADAAIDPNGLLGARAVMNLRDAFGGDRAVTGIVSEAEVEPREDGAGVRVVVSPAIHPFTLGRDCRTFQELDAVEIAKRVLAGAKVRWQLADSYPKRHYTAQYRESDWAFVSRLFEEEGIYYWFDHEDGSALVVADRSEAAADLTGGAALPYHHAAGLQAASEAIVELGITATRAPAKVSLGGFDPARPAFKPSASHGDDGLEHYDAPGAGPTDPAVIAAHARVKREAMAAEAALLAGKSSCARLVPGRAFDLAGHPFSRFDGRYLVVRAELAVDGIGFARASGNAAPLEVKFLALPKKVPYRARQDTPTPRHVGLHSGVVIGPGGEEIHPDEGGRVRLQQHWDRSGARDETSGRWVRVAQRGTAGSMLLPRIGWNVLSVGEEGSVDLPVVMARTFDADHPPPYALPDNKTRVAYKTATSPGDGSHNEIRFEDKQGAEEMFMNASRDMNVQVNDQKTETVHGQHDHDIGNDHSLEVGATSEVFIQGDQQVKVGASQKEKVGAARAKLVSGSESVKVGGSRKYSTGANNELTAASRSLRVGAAQLDVTLGSVESLAGVMLSTLVGGAMVKATPRPMTEAVGTALSVSTGLGKLPAGIGMVAGLPGVSGAVGALAGKVPSAALGLAVQTIGIAKFELGGVRTITVQKGFLETVLGMMVLSTPGEIADEALTSYDLNALALTGSADQITIESPVSVTVQCGDGCKLTVSAKEGISLEAPTVELKTASVMSAKAAEIRHNE